MSARARGGRTRGAGAPCLDPRVPPASCPAVAQASRLHLVPLWRDLGGIPGRAQGQNIVRIRASRDAQPRGTRGAGPQAGLPPIPTASLPVQAPQGFFFSGHTELRVLRALRGEGRVSPHREGHQRFTCAPYGLPGTREWIEPRRRRRAQRANPPGRGFDENDLYANQSWLSERHGMMRSWLCSS